jgi:hypothetical protein
MRSFIVHDLGMTEYTYPANPEAIRAMVDSYKQGRRAHFAQMGGNEGLESRAGQFGRATVAEHFVTGVSNLALPDGFELKFYPRNVTVDGVTYPIYPKV